MIQTVFRTGLILSWLLTACLFVCAQVPKTESPLPAPTAPVNDYANVIDDATEARINARLVKLTQITSPKIEFAVVTVPTTGGRDIFDYSLAVARGWGIGADAEGDNPGLLFLAAIDDRKYFTQISRDLEGDLTDGEAGQIQRQNLVPAFRQGNYGKGIEDTINAYISNIAQSRGFDAAQVVGQIVNDSPRRGERPRTSPRAQPVNSSLGTCCVILVVLFILLFIIGGGGGGGLLSALLWGATLSNLGRGGSSGGWSGGGFGGSGGGGGWGGFGGGGDFGGGGAGGDW